MYHLLSDKLELELGFNDKPLGYALGFIIESLGGLNFH